MSDLTHPNGPDPAGTPEPPVTDPIPGKTRGPRRRTPGEKLAAERPSLTAEQRLFILDLWQGPSLSSPDFSPLVDLSVKTLYSWRGGFDRLGLAGLIGKGPRLFQQDKTSLLSTSEKECNSWVSK